MTSRASLAEAARELEPLRQGRLDGLCGLYAIVNAIRVVIYPTRTLRQPELKRLFDRGLTTLAQARRLRSSITHGITHRLWQRMCDDVVLEAQLITGIELYTEQLFATDAPISSREAVWRIRHSVRAGWPVLMALMDSYDHHAVVVGFSRTRLTLFDSAGLRWVWVRSLSFDGRELGHPHYVPPSTMVALLAF